MLSTGLRYRTYDEYEIWFKFSVGDLTHHKQYKLKQTINQTK